MKKIVLGLIIGLVAGFAVASWIRRAPPAAAKSDSTAESAVEAKPDEKAANPLRLAPAKRQAAGIVVAKPQAVELAPEVEAFGRVLDPTPFVALVAEEATARAAVTASEKELERVKKLYAAGGNASAQAVETAEAAAARDRAALASAQIRLLAGWGQTLAAHANLNEVRENLERGAALVRIDLLPGAKAAADFRKARIAVLGSDEQYDVAVLGPAPIADPQVQGPSYLALLHGHSLPSGAALHVMVPGAGDAAKVLLVPQSAIVYQQGNAWVYVLGKNDTFAREFVTLGRTIGDNVVVSKGVDADDQVATTGAQQLLSAELGAGGEIED